LLIDDANVGAVIGSGREAIVYAFGNDRVVKVFRDKEAVRRARAEFAVTNVLLAHGLPVASPIEIITVDGAPGLISTRARGADLNGILAHAPWKVRAVAARLAAVQLAMHAVSAPPDLPEVRHIVEQRIRFGTSIPPQLAAAALKVLRDLPRGDRMCHGNLHLGNVIVDGDEVIVVDCGDASSGDPLAEVAQTLVRYRCARLRPGAPWPARLGSAIGRRLLARCYLRAYRRSKPKDATLALWEGVRAVERMAEGHSRERRRLARLARRRLG
jgi:thiamine kinase